MDEEVPTFVQIAVSCVSDSEESSLDVLYGLDANGRVWVRLMVPMSRGWRPVDTNIDPKYQEKA
jgi:hypothetical protein